MSDRERLSLLDAIGTLGRCDLPSEDAEIKAQQIADDLSQLLAMDDEKAMANIAAPF